MKIIKQYKNRKYYDTNKASYIDLVDIINYVKDDEELIIVSNETKRDITAKVLTKALFEYQLNSNDFDSLATLREKIKDLGVRG